MSHALHVRLKSARIARGLSARQLSLGAGLSQSMVGQIERCNVEDPGASVLEALAGVLDVSIDWLVTGEGRGPQATGDAA